MSRVTPLEVELRRMIAAEGPLPVDRYMALCLSHPVHGYYAGQDPFGRTGDFITAPEISQMFGELIGLWAAATWRQMGSPSPVLLVELGPGRGTLMADAVRAMRVAPGFRDAASIHLVETSPVLRARQQDALVAAGLPLVWHSDVGQLPDGPLIVVANEFFDALPVSQAAKTADGWHERVVGLDAAGRLAFGMQPSQLPRFETLLPAGLRDSATPGDLYEWRSEGIVSELCQRVRSFGGATLVIDYGHVESGFGDTLQAVREHAFVDPLDAPGNSDLTAHVDFDALGAKAFRCGARAHGPVTQCDFLRRLGIEARVAKLKQHANVAQAADIDVSFARLIGDGKEAMGTLFKVMAFAHPELPAPPGFDT